MVVFNYSGSEINAKIVYYGPALSGKTTNLEHIYERMPSDAKGKMVSMKTRTDRTLFFDFLPLELGDVNGYKTRILLYTVPGQVYYNATRKLVLKGADAVVFVADSAEGKSRENIESLRNLEENLNELGLTLDTIPWVIQFNKRDLTTAVPVRTLEKELNLLGVPSFEAIATQGIGVYETLQSVAGMLYSRLTERLQTAQESGALTARAPEDSADEETVGGEMGSDVIDVALRETNGKALPTPAEGPSIIPRIDVPPPPSVTADAGARPKATADRKTESSGEPTGGDAPVPRRQTTPGAGDGAFRFASLEQNVDSGGVGRVIDLDDEPNVVSRPSPQPASDGEFITDPCRAATAVTDSSEDTERAIGTEEDVSLGEKQPLADDECVITVPVLLSRAQIRKTIPIKLRLEVQVTDEDL